MKHTTFENELREIRRRAIQEMKEALAAHNGRYDFTQFEFTPIVNNEKVCEARLIDGNVFAYTEESFLSLDDLDIYEILGLTTYIAETADVKDVSGIYPVPVTWVDRDDIEMQGFNTDGMTQKDLEKLAERMCDIYNNGDFRFDLDLACKDCGLKEKED